MIRLTPVLLLGATALTAACTQKDADKTPPSLAVAAPAPASPSADNTLVNARDNADASKPTPMGQGNDATDLKITQSIRRAVMADALSMTAKNCKIITSGGKVTLRGPVMSAQERSRIEATARATTDVTEVDDQLEVKSP